MNTISKHGSRLPIIFASLWLCGGTAQAQIADLQAAQAELQALKSLQKATSDRISELEQWLDDLLARSASPGSETVQIDKPPASPALTAPTQAGPPQVPKSDDALTVTGDMILRYESNFADGQANDRDRLVMRGRLGATYRLDEHWSVGGLMETGDPDDPNSGYLTVSDFADDFQISLSRAYTSYQFGDTTLYGGKFPKPFVSTDLLWDGDVNPTGLGFRQSYALNNRTDLSLSGLFFAVDESAVGADSNMVGGQANIDGEISALNYQFAVGYYDYDFGSVAGADAGDFRTNLRDLSGNYLSDYDLLDLMAQFQWSGISETWPLNVSLDLVKNLGAAVDADTAYSAAVGIGRDSHAGDLTFTYRFRQADVDSVLAAFSHDNYAFGTNYRAHELAAAYVLSDQLRLAASIYRYRPLDPRYAGALDPNLWLNRARLNLILTF